MWRQGAGGAAPEPAGTSAPEPRLREYLRGAARLIGILGAVYVVAFTPAGTMRVRRRVGEAMVDQRQDIAGVDFEATTLPHLKPLFRLALRLTGDAADAEDLVQETYLRALQSFDSLRDP